MSLNREPKLPLTETVDYLALCPDGSTHPAAEIAAVEHTLTLTVNGEIPQRMVCTGEHLPQLILGRLCTGGRIRSLSEVKALELTADGGYASVTLDGIGAPEPLRPLPQHTWKAEWLFLLAEQFRQDTPIHGRSWATHSCFLAMEGEVLFSCEDIGRHNALDKAVGYAVEQRLDRNRCILVSSGRIPVDMAEKPIRAGIPVLCTKSHPTAEAIALAKQYGLTLVGFGQDLLKQYT